MRPSTGFHTGNQGKRYEDDRGGVEDRQHGGGDADYHIEARV